MQARIVIAVGVLAALSPPAIFAQASGADAAAVQREAEFEAARIRREAEEAAAARAIESQVESARQEMEAARTQLERAAQRLVIQTQGVDVDDNGQRRFVFLGENGNMRSLGPEFTTWAALGGVAARAQIGAAIVEAEGGVLVTHVADGSGAADAGLKVGDVIQSIDGIDLADGVGSPDAEITARLAAIDAGATVQFVVERGGDEINIGVETQEGSPYYSVFNLQSNPQVILRSERAAANAERAVSPMRVFSLAGAPWGDMELVPITPELGRYFETTEGLLVVRAPSDDAVGLQDGDVILAIGDRTPTSAEHAIRILGSFEPGEVIEFSLMRDARRQPVQYTVEESGFRYFAPNIVVAPGTPAPATAPVSPTSP